MPSGCPTALQKLNYPNLYKLNIEYRSHYDKYMKARAGYEKKKSNIDNLTPRLPIKFYYKPPIILGEVVRLKEIYQQNLCILEKINVIQRITGRTASSSFNACRPIWNANFSVRITNNQMHQKHNKALYERIRKARSNMEPTEMLEQGFKDWVQRVAKKSQYPLVLPDLMDRKNYSLYTTTRPIIYLDVGIRNDRPLGRLLFLLYDDVTPTTVHKFLDVCDNSRKNQRSSLVGTVFHRIFPKLYIEGGRIDALNKSEFFLPENYILQHGCKGTLAMMPNASGLLTGCFTISLKPLHVLDGKRVAFGKLIRGITVLQMIEAFGTKNGKTKQVIEITDCGITCYE